MMIMGLIDDVKKDINRSRGRLRDWHWVAFAWLVIFFKFYYEQSWVVDYWVTTHYWIVNVIMGIAMFVFMYQMIKYMFNLGGDKGWW